MRENTGICLLNDSFPPLIDGVANTVVNYARELTKLGARAIVVTPDSNITCKADLAGKTVSVQTGTTAEEYCMENGYEVLAFAANNDAAAALTSGKAAAWVVDNEVGVALAAQQGLVVLDEAMPSEPYAFAFAKDSALTAQFDEALGELLADGTVAAIFEKYGVLYVAP